MGNYSSSSWVSIMWYGKGKSLLDIGAQREEIYIWSSYINSGTTFIFFILRLVTSIVEQVILQWICKKNKRKSDTSNGLFFFLCAAHQVFNGLVVDCYIRNVFFRLIVNFRKNALQYQIRTLNKNWRHNWRTLILAV